MQVFVKLRTTAHIIITTNLSSKIFKLCTFWLEEFSGMTRLNYGEETRFFENIFYCNIKETSAYASVLLTI